MANCVISLRGLPKRVGSDSTVDSTDATSSSQEELNCEKTRTNSSKKTSDRLMNSSICSKLPQSFAMDEVFGKNYSNRDVKAKAWKSGGAVERIWIPHEELGFTPGVLIGQADDGKKMLVQLDSGETTEVDIQNPTPVHPSCLSGVADLLSLGEFDIGPLLHNVRVRYFKNEIYTAVGAPILVSINPYAAIPHLYSPETAAKYRSEAGGNLDGTMTLEDLLNSSDDESPQDNNEKSKNEKVSNILPPHPFRIAQAALNHMYGKQSDQSIIISGESGAGKTEATKIILGYLAEVSGMPGLRVSSPTAQPERRARLLERQAGEKTFCGIEMQITESNHLLESFGNAKTIRNDNSSRFGKFTQVYFELDTRKLVGAQITNYLLEKSRIVTQQDDERNYHIFYQLCAGQHLLDAELRELLQLSNAEDFNYLNQCTSVSAIDDVDDFDQLLICFKGLEFTNEEQKNIFSLLAAILHLGNVDIDPVPEDDTIENDPEDTAAYNCTSFIKASALLGVDRKDLLHLLQYKMIPDVMTKRKIAVVRTEAEIMSAKDALCKATYERLFQWLVDKVNCRLAVSFGPSINGAAPALRPRACGQARPSPHIPGTSRRRPTQGSIGLLDIFGFEVFEVNSFEQLCINFANEQLQQHFNLHVFREEQFLYQNEGIDWTRIKFEDNQNIIDALTNRINGVFPMLDSECLIPKATDSTFLSKVYSVSETTPLLIKPAGLKRMGQFGIEHYAGPVYYSPTSFLDKNRDRVHQEVHNCVNTSCSTLLKELYKEGAHKTTTTKRNSVRNQREGEATDNQLTGTAAGRSVNTLSTGFTNNSVSYTFRTQLTGLTRVLGMTTASYIRCIKPNGLKAAMTFESIEVLRQLKCAGMLESIRIRKAGYPIRLEVRPLLMRYRVLLKAPEMEALTNPNHVTPEHLKRITYDLLTRSTKNSKILENKKNGITQKELWQIGNTQIFMKDCFQNLLEHEATFAWCQYATIITKHWRGYMERKKYQATIDAAKAVQSWGQCMLLNQVFLDRTEQRIQAAKRIQRFWKANMLRSRNKTAFKKAVRMIAAVWRRYLIFKRCRLLAERALNGELLTPAEWSQGYANFKNTNNNRKYNRSPFNNNNNNGGGRAMRRGSKDIKPGTSHSLINCPSSSQQQGASSSSPSYQRPQIPPLKGLKKRASTLRDDGYADNNNLNNFPEEDSQTDITYEEYEASTSSPRDGSTPWNAKRQINRNGKRGKAFSPRTLSAANAAAAAAAAAAASGTSSNMMQRLLALMETEKEKALQLQRRLVDTQAERDEYLQKLRDYEHMEADFARRMREKQLDLERAHQEIERLQKELNAEYDRNDALELDVENLTIANENLNGQLAEKENSIEILVQHLESNSSKEDVTALQSQIRKLQKNLDEAHATIQLRNRQLAASKPNNGIANVNLNNGGMLTSRGNNLLNGLSLRGMPQECSCMLRDGITSRDYQEAIKSAHEERRKREEVCKVAKQNQYSRQQTCMVGLDLLGNLEASGIRTNLNCCATVEDLRKIFNSLIEYDTSNIATDEYYDDDDDDDNNNNNGDDDKATASPTNSCSTRGYDGSRTSRPLTTHRESDGFTETKLSTDRRHYITNDLRRNNGGDTYRALTAKKLSRPQIDSSEQLLYRQPHNNILETSLHTNNDGRSTTRRAVKSPRYITPSTSLKPRNNLPNEYCSTAKNNNGDISSCLNWNNLVDHRRHSINNNNTTKTRGIPTYKRCNEQE